MGYYVCVREKNEEFRRKVLAFFGENFRPLTQRCVPPVRGRDVCAYAKPCDIGFYYNSACEEVERAHLFGIIRWMALRTGAEPHYFYEDERRPVLRRSENTHLTTDWNQDFDLVDEVAFTPSVGVALEEAHTWEDGPTKDRAIRAHQADILVRAELERLTALWPL